MKSLKLFLFSLLLSIACLIPSSAFAQAKQPAPHLSTACVSSPSDANCDNHPASECIPYGYRLIHTSGWVSSTGVTMGTSLYRSDTCKTIWSVTNSGNGLNVNFRTGVTVVNDNHGWWTGCAWQNNAISPMAYASSENVFGEAIDCGNNQTHTTPTYPV